jgi:hypothetical protein
MWPAAAGLLQCRQHVSGCPISGDDGLCFCQAARVAEAKTANRKNDLLLSRQTEPCNVPATMHRKTCYEMSLQRFRAGQPRRFFKLQVKSADSWDGSAVTTTTHWLFSAPLALFHAQCWLVWPSPASKRAAAVPCCGRPRNSSSTLRTCCSVSCRLQPVFMTKSARRRFSSSGTYAG